MAGAEPVVRIAEIGDVAVGQDEPSQIPLNLLGPLDDVAIVEEARIYDTSERVVNHAVVVWRMLGVHALGRELAVEHDEEPLARLFARLSHGRAERAEAARHRQLPGYL